MNDNTIKNTIIEYLKHELTENSLILYEVNGNPSKRSMRIKELAHYLYKRMSTVSRKELYRKINEDL